MKVHGSTELQSAALPENTNAVVYVPDEHANGADSFSFSATNFPGVAGDLFDSATSVVDIEIAGVNDAPKAYSWADELEVDTGKSIRFVGSDYDDSPQLYLVLVKVSNGLSVSAAGTSLAFGPEVTDIELLPLMPSVPSEPTYAVNLTVTSKVCTGRDGVPSIVYVEFAFDDSEGLRSAPCATTLR